MCATGAKDGDEEVRDTELLPQTHEVQVGVQCLKVELDSQSREDTVDVVVVDNDHQRSCTYSVALDPRQFRMRKNCVLLRTQLGNAEQSREEGLRSLSQSGKKVEISRAQNSIAASSTTAIDRTVGNAEVFFMKDTPG